eukprot:677454-Amphidinium_carterae.1
MVARWGSGCRIPRSDKSRSATKRPVTRGAASLCKPASQILDRAEVAGEEQEKEGTKILRTKPFQIFFDP